MEIAGKKRPIEANWQCKMSGDCCRSVSMIVMTRQEAHEIAKARPDLLHTLQVYVHPDPRFVFLKGQPCPLLNTDNSCSVYSVRPYSCRRFKCYRPDVKNEPYEPEPVDLLHGRLGCANLSDRLALSRAVRRDYALNQRKAQKWALKHGWTPDQVPQGSASRIPYHQFEAAASSGHAGVLTCGTVHTATLYSRAHYSADSGHDDGVPSVSESACGNMDKPPAHQDTTLSRDVDHVGARQPVLCNEDSRLQTDTLT